MTLQHQLGLIMGRVVGQSHRKISFTNVVATDLKFSSGDAILTVTGNLDSD